MTLQRIWIPSPCYHGRNDSGVRLIVLHTAEGARTIEDLGHFFQNYNNQVSSHVGADDKLGKIGEYVTRGNAAWTQANYNNTAVALELCGFASWSTATWKNDHHNMLENCARWIAEESDKFGIPITRLNNSQAQGGGRGVCQHVNLGAGGGNHVDCGSGFPMDYVLNLAKGGISEEEDMGDCNFYLRFKDGGDRSDITLTNSQSAGNHRIRFACRVPQTMEVDTHGHGTERFTIGPDGPKGFNISEGCQWLTVIVNEPSDLMVPIAVAIGKK